MSILGPGRVIWTLILGEMASDVYSIGSANKMLSQPKKLTPFQPMGQVGEAPRSSAYRERHHDHVYQQSSSSSRSNHTASRPLASDGPHRLPLFRQSSISFDTSGSSTSKAS